MIKGEVEHEKVRAVHLPSALVAVHCMLPYSVIVVMFERIYYEPPHLGDGLMTHSQNSTSNSEANRSAARHRSDPLWLKCLALRHARRMSLACTQVNDFFRYMRQDTHGGTVSRVRASSCVPCVSVCVILQCVRLCSSSRHKSKKE